jgi:hypothetical protein
MDTRDTRVSNLLFLLTAAPLGVACVITDDGDTDTIADTSTNPTTTNGTTAGETEGATAESTVTPPGETTETPSETTETPSETTEGPGDTTAGSTDGGELPPICTTYGDQITECYMDEKAGASAAMYCGEVIAGYEKAYGAECVTAFEEFLACLSALTCEEFTGADPVCEEQNMALETACAAK